MQCTAINPDVCCGGGGISESSVLISWVPREWTIDAMGFGGGGCTFNKWLAQLRGRTDFCMGPNGRENYTGARYWFVGGRKRDEIEENSNCTETVKPDTLILADGTTMYNIVGLDDAKVDELVSYPPHAHIYPLAGNICCLFISRNFAIAESGVGPEGVPEEFHALRNI